MSDSEQNKTEDPTPFKLRKARERGQLARGMDLPFFASLVGLLLFFVVFGAGAIQVMSDAMALSVSMSGTPHSNGNNIALLAIAQIYPPVMRLIFVFAACTVSFVILVQILQNGGLLFTTEPIKPDWTKINPGKGLKRIFSLRTLKEAGKNILKMGIYLGGTYLVILHCLSLYGANLQDAQSVARGIYGSSLRLLYLYLGLGFFFALLDQVIVRKEFFNQMKMSKSEVEREVKDREGDPRIKRKRKELHQDFAKQTGSLGDLPGSDMLIVNPQHFAVGLQYDPDTMEAPIVSTKGRNRFALLLKSKAERLGIPILANPPLARALFRSTVSGQPIPEQHFKAVADSYVAALRLRPTPESS